MVGVGSSVVTNKFDDYCAGFVVFSLRLPLKSVDNLTIPRRPSWKDGRMLLLLFLNFINKKINKWINKWINAWIYLLIVAIIPESTWCNDNVHTVRFRSKTVQYYIIHVLKSELTSSLSPSNWSTLYPRSCSPIMSWMSLCLNSPRYLTFKPLI